MFFTIRNRIFKFFFNEKINISVFVNQTIVKKKEFNIVSGLIKAISILDEVIKTIRASKNKVDAKYNLVDKYQFTEEQAEAIVMLQLYRLTNTDIFALKKEQEELKDKIIELEEILANEKKLLSVIVKELNQTLKELSTPRLTVIQEKIDELNVETNILVPKEEIVLQITYQGYIKKLSKKAFNAEDDRKFKDDDFLIAEYNSYTTSTLLLFTNKGNYVYLPLTKVPDCKHRDVGTNVSILANIETGEKIIFSFPVEDFDEEKYVLFTTKNGFIKRTLLKEFKAVRYSNALMATKINAAAGDELVSVDVTTGDKNKEVIVVTRQGFINRYDASEVSVYAPASIGVKAIDLKDRGDEIIGAKYVSSNKDLILMLLAKGGIKRFKVDDIVKGHKNNVAKSYTNVGTTKMTILTNDVEIIHKDNINEDLSAFLIGDKGLGQLDYNNLKSANPSIPKKLNTSEIGKVQKLIIMRNDNDLK